MKHYMTSCDMSGIRFTACGIIGVRIEPQHSTRTKRQVTCKNCKRAIRKHV